MLFRNPQHSLRLFLYGGGSVVLLLDIYFLVRAILTDNFVPIIPILAGIFTAAGLLFIIWAEQCAKEEDKKDHRRISRVAHQLESPLYNLRSDLASLQVDASNLPSQQRLQLKRMETKAEVLLDNIRDLFLTLQAIEGPVSQNIRVYDLCAIVQEAIKRTAPLASAHNIELIYQTHCNKALVRADRRLLLIALIHLIENAIFYTMTPGIANVTVVKGKKRTRVIVQDRGIGIRGNDVSLVDRPFARGSDAEKYDPDGIGLGIALSHLIVREIGGSLSWHSKDRGLGSQFEIHLPLVQN